MGDAQKQSKTNNLPVYAPPRSKGNKPGPGRKLGQPNKLTRDLREMIQGALEDVGGRSYLAKQAKEKPVAFLALLGKILPTQVTGLGGGPIRIADEASLAKLPPGELEALMKQLIAAGLEVQCPD